MRPINICFLSGDITRSGGTESVTAGITNELVKNKNYNITILSILNISDKNYYSFDERIMFSVLYDKKRASSYFKTIFKLRRFVKSNSVDILVDIDTILQLYSIPATFFTKTKSVAWEHFNFHENLGVIQRDWGRKLAARFADAIITITKEDQDYFESNLKLKCPIFQIYNPIEITERRNNFSSDSKLILSAGRITHQKGFDILVDVAKGVFEMHPNWKWYILGEGKDRPIIEEKIKTLNIQDKLILKGNVKNIAEYYKKSSIFVLTSRYEGFGLVLTEAKSYGLPCVSFACKAGPKEIIIDGVNGFLIDYFDIHDMADKIVKLIEDKDLRVEFSMNSLKDTNKFLIDSIIPKWVNLFKELTNDNEKNLD